jgi:hypothetical protein
MVGNRWTTALQSWIEDKYIPSVRVLKLVIIKGKKENPNVSPHP